MPSLTVPPAPMQSILFPDLHPRKAVVAQFDTPLASSDGGSPLLTACDKLLGLTAALVACLGDTRLGSRVKHSFADMLRQRVFGIALGYFDCNDSDRLRADPVLKMLLGRDPDSPRDLASQPTLSRFENTVGPRDLLRMARALATLVLQRQRERRKTARVITIDLDPTCDPTHGDQQLSLFNRFYDTACFLPLVGCVTFDDEDEQYLVAAVLRPGNAPAKQGMIGLLKRLLPLLREEFPRARLRIRLDAGFQGGELLSYLHGEGVQVVLCLAANKVLKELAEPVVKQVRKDYEPFIAELEQYWQDLAEYEAAQAQYRRELAEHAAAARAALESGGEPPKPPKPPTVTEPLKPLWRPGPRYDQVLYGAGTWGRRWRVLIKADMVFNGQREPKLNVRFVLTDIGGSPRRVYERIYCGRGDAENRLKELKAGLGLDRTSCHRFLANQFRVLLAAAAYALMQELRWQARETEFARAQVPRLRDFLLKIAVRVQVTVRRIVLHLPLGAPAAAEWVAIAGHLGGVGPPVAGV